MSILFRCCDSERIPISQSYAGIVLWVTSLLAFRTGSFEKFNFCIRSSLCQAKIYQGIPKRNKVRIKSQKVSTSFINYLLLVYSHFTTHVAYVLPPATLFFFSLCSVCLICLALFVPSLLHHTYFSLLFLVSFSSVLSPLTFWKLYPVISFLGSHSAVPNYLKKQPSELTCHGQRHNAAVKTAGIIIMLRVCQTSSNATVNHLSLIRLFLHQTFTNCTLLTSHHRTASNETLLNPLQKKSSTWLLSLQIPNTLVIKIHE